MKPKIFFTPCTKCEHRDIKSSRYEHIATYCKKGYWIDYYKQNLFYDKRNKYELDRAGMLETGSIMKGLLCPDFKGKLKEVISIKANSVDGKRYNVYITWIDVLGRYQSTGEKIAIRNSHIENDIDITHPVMQWVALHDPKYKGYSSGSMRSFTGLRVWEHETNHTHTKAHVPRRREGLQNHLEVFDSLRLCKRESGGIRVLVDSREDTLNDRRRKCGEKSGRGAASTLPIQKG